MTDYAPHVCAFSGLPTQPARPWLTVCSWYREQQPKRWGWWRWVASRLGQ